MRRALTVAALAGLIVLSGCAGTAMQQSDTTSTSHSYDWNTSSAVTVSVQESSYRAVYTLDGERRLNLSVRSEFGGREPLEVRNVAFRYRNGTVVNESLISVETGARKTKITLPSGTGSFAYTTDSPSRSVLVPVVDNRSHEVILPPGMRIGFPIFGGAIPDNFEKRVVEDRVYLTWQTVETSVISVDYYLQRDLVLFGGLLAVLGVGTAAGLVYFLWRIRRLEAARSRAGIDIDEDS
ncbi:MAG: DUF5803 family protein [Halanaeroarchaeum sp.]